MLTEARVERMCCASTPHALSASRTHASGVDPDLPATERGVAGKPVTVAEAFWLATAGGGEARPQVHGPWDAGERPQPPAPRR